MPEPPGTSSPRIPLPVFAIAAVAALLVAFAASPLPRMTPDSAVYMTGAESIATSGTFVGCEREITEYAPGYPAALALFIVSGLDAPDAARIVNVLSTAILVLAASLLARATGLGRRASVLVALATAAAPVTLRNGAAVWSETVFSTLLVLLLLAIVNRSRGLAVRASGRVVVVLVLSWALLLTRYTGLFVVPAVVLAGWLGSRDLDRRALRVVALTGGVLVVPALWWLRNVHVGTGLFGSRSRSPYSILDVLGQVPDGLSSVALPVDAPLVIRLVVLAPLVFAAVLGVLRRRLPTTVLGVVVAGYAAGVIYAATRTSLDHVDARLLSPVLVPGAVLVAHGIALSSLEPRVQRILRTYAVVVVGAMALIAPGVAWYLHDADRAIDLDFPVSCAEWPSRYGSLRAPAS